MNIEIIQTICSIIIPIAILEIGLKIANWLKNRALEKEDLEATIYCRDMYRDIYKNFLNRMSNISHWLVTYKHSPSMTSRALRKIEALDNAAKEYKTLWENNEKLIPLNMR